MPPSVVLAFLPLLATLAFEWLVRDLIGPHPWFLFYPAAYLTTWFGSRRVVTTAIVVTTACIWWLLLPSVPEATALREFFASAVFLATGALFIVFHNHRLSVTMTRLDLGAKGLVKAHGGQIHAEGTPGGNTTFVFTIPLDGVPSPSPEEQPPAARA